ncbi:MAG TPA: hypothetical protein VFA38_04175 [Nitrospirales bacterium]|nr:hypothetical protein [Nitrospirales bacterium]
MSGFHHAGFVAHPSLDEWILAVLRYEGPQSVDQLAARLPAPNWAQIFAAVDRLSRDGWVSMSRPQHGDYWLSIR